MQTELKALLTKDVLKIITLLEPYESRLVGGSVRDALAGMSVGDIDIATTAEPNEVMARLKAAGMEVVPTGIEHGTVTAVASGVPYEITTLRKDVSTDGRRATVAFSESFEEDAARRDFTINALYLDKNGKVYDFFGGLEDLENKTLRFIGKAEERITEDHLRVLRYFRFFARFGLGEVPVDVQNIFKSHAHLLAKLSKERVTGGLLKILAHEKSVPAISEMARLEIFAPIGLNSPNVSALEKFEALFDERDSLLKLLALYGEKAEEVLLSPSALLCFSNKQKAFVKAVCKALRRKVESGKLEVFLYKYGKEPALGALKIFAVRGEVEAEVALSAASLKVPVFPLKGKDVIALGISEGTRIGEVLKTIEAWWLEEGFPERQACLQKLKDIGS